MIKHSLKAGGSDWLLVICSYQRAETLLSKTLHYLNQTDISSDRIRIVVANSTEYQNYLEILGAKWKDRLIIGEIGIYAVKNFVSRYFPEGQELFFMDDDVVALSKLEGEHGSWKNLKLLLNLTDFITQAFAHTREVKASLWGVYPIYNPFFMKNKPITYDLRFILGRAYGQINSHSEDQRIDTDEFDDSQRTIKAYLRDGKVVRFNRVCISKMYVGPGGMKEMRTKEGKEMKDRALKRMVREYPELCALAWKKGMDRSRRPNRVELLLKDRRGLAMKKKSDKVLGKKISKERVAKKKKEKPAMRVKKDWGVSSMVLRKRTP